MKYEIIRQTFEDLAEKSWQLDIGSFESHISIDISISFKPGRLYLWITRRTDTPLTQLLKYQGTTEMPQSDSLADCLSLHPDFQDAHASTSRLPSLYSDFSRHRQSDPAAFRSNVEWWRKILTEVLKHGWQEENLRLRDTKDAPSNSNDSKGKEREGERQTSRLVLRVDEGLKGNWTLDSVGIPLGLGTVIVSRSDL